MLFAEQKASISYKSFVKYALFIRNIFGFVKFIHNKDKNQDNKSYDNHC